MKSKKGVVEKIFVYLFSIIIIVFAGFLVTKFIFAFLDDTNQKMQTEFYDKLEQDYNRVYKTYGSQKSLEYKLTNDVEYVCFLPKEDCVDNINLTGNVSNFNIEYLKKIVSANDNIVIYDRDDIISSKKIGEFNDNSNCFCIKPQFNKFEVIMENRKNKVYIDPK